MSKIDNALEAIEQELIASMIRNMDRHRAEELKEGYEWSMWQVEQLKALEKYKMENQKKYSRQFKSINAQINELIWQARQRGGMEQETQILRALKNGFKNYKPITATAQAEFFKLNTRKLEALIKATTHDMEKAETAVLRMANDQYRKAIFKAQVYANTGAGTYEKAVDMATKDMLSAGLNCVEYKNGARHALSDYADMAIRTASKRAYLQGEGEKRQEWGISTVIVNKRGNPCPKCLPFVGKVLIDDVWSGGKASDGKYPLMSTAIEKGLYHPRCNDSHSTYFPGISTADDTWTREEIDKIDKGYKREVKQQYAKRQAERFGRLAEYSLDQENQQHNQRKVKQWYEVVKSDKTDIIKLPRYDEAVIPEEKFSKYALDPNKDPDKAKAFKGALGYDLTNYEDLIENIKSKLSEYEAVKKPDKGHGQRYEVVLEITGPNGKTANVLTAWIDDNKNGEMRLTTAHVDRRKKNENRDV